MSVDPIRCRSFHSHLVRGPEATEAGEIALSDLSISISKDLVPNRDQKRGMWDSRTLKLGNWRLECRTETEGDSAV